MFCQMDYTCVKVYILTLNNHGVGVFPEDSRQCKVLLRFQNKDPQEVTGIRQLPWEVLVIKISINLIVFV